MMQLNIHTAGIDTSKHQLDVAVHGLGTRWQVENAPPGWQRLVADLTAAGTACIGIEATGGYERGAVAHLRKAGFCCVTILQPLQVKAYARLHLRRAKNDAIDAALIAACTAALEAPRVEPDARLAELREHLTFVEQLDEDIARLKIRSEHIHLPRLRGIVADQIDQLKALRAVELRYIANALRAHQDLGRRLDLVQSVPGIGERTALAIILHMPELGRISREQAAALAGLAPFDNDSGTHKGQRHIAGGRARLRRSLYAAALAASFRWNPALRALYRRLIGRGKAHKPALTACARKLLIYANAVVQRGTPWLTATIPT